MSSEIITELSIGPISRDNSNTMKQTIEKISTFLAWAVFTFVSHFTAKEFLSRSKHLSEAVIVLTSLQMAAGSVLYLKLMINRGGGGEVKIQALWGSGCC